MANPTSFSIRKTSSSKAILFIHGFGGEAHQTFGMLPAFLAGDMSLIDWDIHCFGFPTSLFPDITGVWAADPNLTTLSQYLIGLLQNGRYSQYNEFAILAHSMGGLIIQRALIDGGLDSRMRHVLLFGTPSNGLRKAGLGMLFKRQVRDMYANSVFISELRRDWTDKYSEGISFNFQAIAGIKDEFVPTSSSVEIFEQEYRSYLPGNHLEMVKPLTADDDIVVLLRKMLTASSPANETLFPSATQLERYFQTVDRLEKLATLSSDEFKELVFALELVGQQDRAIKLLEDSHSGNTELTGILAGRLKRRWLAAPQEREGEGHRSYLLYRQAFEQATQQLDHCQAFYNGINVSFMDLALNRSRYDARQLAVRVLEQCSLAPREKWRLATEGEAYLYIGEATYAIECYEAALSSGPDPREVDSMYKQAVWASRLLEDVVVEKSLQQLFAPFLM